MNMQSGRLLDQDFQLFSTEMVNDAAAHGDSVRLRKLGKPGYTLAPAASYLVYVKLEDDESLTVRHMRLNNLVNGSIHDTEEALLAKARAGDGAPEQVGKDFEKMFFRRPTYFTIILDNLGWDFYYPAPADEVPVAGECHDPIVFIDKKVTLIEQSGLPPIRQQKDYKANTSFYNLEPVVVGGMKAVRCINFYRDENGDPINGNTQVDIGFEILVQAPFELSPAQGRKLILVIDPDGQNQGPPE